ncbi:MAG TPA: RagB/SusD family nutrient uptake outer membrane protein, partial [Candidatus Odoribacter faecigallinarum]|nr:RagB/SusD family nutrient uptake outer membrane protein [Candidatus Odoribacter faecigallinarum]
SYTVEGETFSRNTEEIRHYFNLVRFRAGLPGMTAQEASDYNTVRDMIRRERQIELAWEGHRYFDVRRWEIANVEENEPIYGVDINQSENNPEAFYQKVVVREAEYTYKSFVRRQNFWPIPNDEIIRNPNLVQSPGW